MHLVDKTKGSGKAPKPNSPASFSTASSFQSLSQCNEPPFRPQGPGAAPERVWVCPEFTLSNSKNEKPIAVSQKNPRLSFLYREATEHISCFPLTAERKVQGLWL